MEGKTEEVEDIGSASSGSFIDNSDDGSSTFELDDKAHPEEPFTEEEIEGLIAELLEVEGKAAEAQEALEEESLNKVEIEVRRELEQTLQGDDLESAVADEMTTLKEEWEAVLDDLETESSYLLEQLDMAGVELPRLYKWIEKEAPNGCLTEAWKKRNHWVGTRATEEFVESVADAEKYLQVCRPVRRRHGKLLEEGASGFLQKRLDESSEPVKEKTEADWDMFNKIFHDGSDADASFGSKNWASVYLASTPQQAAQIGLEFPGVNEVEEIDDIDGTSADPFIAAAIANEKEIELSDGQKRKFKKVKEEDDVIVGRKLQMHLKRRRYRKNKKQRETIESLKQKFSSVDCSNPDMEEETCDDGEKATNNEVGCLNMKNDNIEDLGSNYDLDHVEPMNIGPLPELSKSSLPDVEQRGAKRLNDGEDCSDTKKSRTVINSGDEADVVENNIVRNTNALDDQSEMQGTCTRIVDGLPSQHLDKKFCCTICDKVALEIHEHPLLKVIICRDCNSLIEEKKHMKDLHPDCSECYCAWCGGNNELVSCKSCKMLFCNNCIKKNLGTEFLAEVRATGWLCYCCRPNLLQRLLSQQEKAMESVKTSVSSSSSDSDNSQAEINVTISSKRKRKKKIRRILDDAELGEETKRKIAIEKERQERLESLRVQFSASSNIMGSSGYNGNLSEGGSSEVLGDALTGYVVNVVREKGEEAVRIPPSISAKLKAHQIVGIRFMWENIIQSIRKVKSGDKGLGCILAHTMGLGKTFQVIAFLYTAMRSTDLGLRTALIVTPVNVLHNWRQEFIKWGPSEVKPLRVFMLEDVSRDRRAEILAKWRKKGGIFLIGYTAFRNLSFGKHVKDRHKAREICRALQDGPDILVCDEAHIIKNIKADITQALKQVKCHRRIALTGSPLQNNLMEYYCMVDFVREGFLGSSHEFRNRFQNPIENGQHTNSTLDDVKIMNQRSHILYEHLKGFVQRMDMNVAKKDLPPKTVFVISVKLSTLQRKLYKRFLDVHGFTNDRASNEKMRKRCFFVGYQALAQIWNHPGILQLTKEEKDYVRQEDAVENFLVDDSSSDENSDYNVPVGEKVRCANELLQRKDESGFFLKGWWNDLLHEKNYKELDYSGKMVLLLDILTMSSDVGDKVLVFSQSIPTLDLIELYLSRLPRRGKHGKLWKKGKDWYRLDGRTESSERQKLVERFNEPSNNRVKCSLISTRAGSLGINLHAANRVVIVDGSWNPTYDLQAIYRAWRYGQRKPVFAYRLLAHGTMEDKIYKRQVTKEGLAARVVDRQQVYRTISKEEMLHLFEFGDDENPETLAELSQGNGHSVEQTVPHSNGTSHSDKLMESLLSKHHPKWIANYHEHESLLQENEEEKLSKEEQDMAWEVYRKTLEWEEVQRVPLGESLPVQKPQEPNAAPPAPKTRSLSPTRLRNSFVTRKCTKLSHLLTLRSQGTKFGCSTVCGECAQEIRWEDLKNTDGRAARWIANYHEHESLLQENEEEKLSKEEQDMAWEVYRKTLEWEEVQRVPLGESLPVQKPQEPNAAPPAPKTRSLSPTRLRNSFVTRKCTKLSHLLTLRSQGTKFGCSTVCGECAQEIRWEDLKNTDGRAARWIANYHEHESLLQENEEEKLSKEEQDMAWEVYRKTLEWEEVQRVPLGESLPVQKPQEPNAAPPAPKTRSLSPTRLRNSFVTRKCTKLSHLLTLRSQGTKFGCSTVCGECAQEIRWEDLKNTDGRAARWIANYHEHESLLQENEEEKLSKEEQDMAWEVYRKTLEWEEVQRVPLGESLPVQKPQEPNAAPPAPKTRSLSPTRLRNSFVTRKCTKLSHLLTLRSQGTKFGCSTVCGECAQEIRWEDLKNTDGRAARWIANYHEHESLLQENEEEKLSKEEQDMAWEVYRKTLEWEEVQRVPLGESLPVQKPQEPNAAPPAPKTRSLSPTRLRNSFVTRKCTKLSHLLTLRSQGTKFGCSTVCGECAQEIRWEDLKNTDGRAAR